MSMKKLYGTTGMPVLCKKCGDHVVSLAHDVYEGSAINETMFTPANQTLISGDLLHCKKCGGEFMRQDKGFWTGNKWSRDIVNFPAKWGKGEGEILI